MKTYIYLVETEDQKVYVGKTMNQVRRRSCHKKTYGTKSTFTIIDEVDSTDREKWEPLETKWIQYYINAGYEVVNIRKKGGGGPEFHTQASKDKQSKAMIGRPKPESFKEVMSILKKGNTNKLGCTLTQESKDKISKSNKGKVRSEENKKKVSESLMKGGNKIISQKKKEWALLHESPVAKKVLQMDPITREIIKIWKSRSEAMKNGYTGAMYSLGKKGHIYKGSIWEYEIQTNKKDK